MSSYHWLHASKGQTSLHQWCDLTSSSDGSTSSGDGSTILSIKYCQKYMIQNRTSSETHNWYVYATWETEPKHLGFTQMTFQGVVEGQNILLILSPICLLWNNLWSVCRYIIGPVSGCSSQDGTSQQHLAAPIRKYMSGIGDHRFTFPMDLLSNYTFYINLTIFSIRRLLIEDVTSLMVFNLWKVEKITQHRLMLV